jgi:hypothetical protein
MSIEMKSKGGRASNRSWDLEQQVPLYFIA